MPKGSKVEEVYEALLKKGYDKGKAARIAQSQTGEALATGRPETCREDGEQLFERWPVADGHSRFGSESQHQRLAQRGAGG